jgi:hypothetical protein
LRRGLGGRLSFVPRSLISHAPPLLLFSS